MLPFKNIIQLDRENPRSIYLQLCDQMIHLIKTGKLSPGIKLPGTRRMAELLGVHRKTIVAAYEELEVQGWIISKPAIGSFVSKRLPVVRAQSFGKTIDLGAKDEAGFSFSTFPLFNRPIEGDNGLNILRINDGDPDVRLAPIAEITRHYRNIANKNHHQHLLTYGSTFGNETLRKTLVTYLNQTRGLHIEKDNILITRGSQMGVYLSSLLLFKPGDKVIVGSTNYRTFELTCEQQGAKLIRVPDDENGLDTQAIARHCAQEKIKAVFVTSHHHHPTTVTLSAERRMHLLQIAQQYKLAVIEDDYDYDFHYSNAPILPLASSDSAGNVLYVGGFTKTIAPAIRIGYLVGPKAFIRAAANLRRIIDRQGDQLLEQVLARMINSGDITRHCNKARKEYKIRRDLFCSLLSKELSTFFEFKIPDGGMAVWVKLKDEYDWAQIYQLAPEFGIVFNNHWSRYDTAQNRHNGIRMGFAKYNEGELETLIQRLKKLMNAIYFK